MAEYNDVWYKSPDGLELYARDYPAANVEDSREDNQEGSRAVTVLCIPGLTRNSADFHELSLRLQKHYRVVTVDLRGRGRSAYDDDPSNYNPLVYAEDVKALIRKLNPERVVLLGTSLGGLVSLLIAAGQLRGLAGLILNDVGPVIESAGLERIKSYVGKANGVRNWDEAVAQTIQLNRKELPDLSDKDWLAFTRNLFKPGPDDAPVLAYDPAISVPFASQGNVPQSALWNVYDAVPQVPALLIRGELSDIVSTSCVAEMQRRRPDLRVATVPARGHAPLLNEPAALAAIDELLDAVEDCLSGHAAI